MQRVKFLTAFLLSLLPMSATAEENGKITKYLRGFTPIFDESGKEIERVDSKKLPKNIEVIGAAANGNLRIDWAGRKVFLRRADIAYDGPPPCELSVESRVSGMGKAGASVPGMRAGAGSSGKACVRKAP